MSSETKVNPLNTPARRWSKEYILHFVQRRGKDLPFLCVKGTLSAPTVDVLHWIGLKDYCIALNIGAFQSDILVPAFEDSNRLAFNYTIPTHLVKENADVLRTHLNELFSQLMNSTETLEEAGESKRKEIPTFRSSMSTWTKEALIRVIQQQSDKDDSFPFLMGNQRDVKKALTIPVLMWIGIPGQYTFLDADSLLLDMRHPVYEDADSISVNWTIHTMTNLTITHRSVLVRDLNELLMKLFVMTKDHSSERHRLETQSKNIDAVVALRHFLDMKTFGALYVGAMEGKCHKLDTLSNILLWYNKLSPEESSLASYEPLDDTRGEIRVDSRLHVASMGAAVKFQEASDTADRIPH